MPGVPAPEYVQARRVLLDALEVLTAHLPGLTLVGAQAVYLHTGGAAIAVPEYTTDADMAVAPDLIAASPLLADALTGAGFQRATDPGRWISPDGVYLDLLVPESLAGPAGGVPTSVTTGDSPPAAPMDWRPRLSIVNQGRSQRSIREIRAPSRFGSLGQRRYSSPRQSRSMNAPARRAELSTRMLSTSCACSERCLPPIWRPESIASSAMKSRLRRPARPLRRFVACSAAPIRKAR